MSSFTNDGLRFLVSDSGPVSGPPVVLLHGFPQRSTCWAAVAQRLNRRGYRTLAPDQRGYSPMARPRGRASYRLPRLVGDVAALIGQVRRPVHLVGHDWGAVVAWALAADRPDLVCSLVTVSAPHPRAYLQSLLTSTQAARSAYVAFFQLPLLPETLARLAPGAVEAGLRSTGMPPQALDRFRPEMIDGGALGPALGWYRAVPLTGVRAPTGTVAVPTTHVWSDGDRALTRSGAERSGAQVEAPYRLEILAGVSHWIPDEAPERLARVIDERAGRLEG
jgi:pimeloyl-ACP methyl ester carboxylesterase